MNPSAVQFSLAKTIAAALAVWVVLASIGYHIVFVEEGNDSYHGP